MKHAPLPSLFLLVSCASTPTFEPLAPELPTVETVEDWREARFREAVEVLTVECPLNADVLVEVVQIPGAYWGLCSWDEEAEQYVILVDSRQHFQGLISTLEHEWAHAMVWDASRDEGYDGHGPMWGVAFARCYRIVLEALNDGDESHMEECP